MAQVRSGDGTTTGPDRPATFKEEPNVELLVDDHSYQPAGSPDQTVRELAHEVSQPADDRVKRMVIAVRCEGELVPDEKLESVMEAPVSQFRRLELHTQPVRALVRGTLTQAINIFEETDVSRHRIADLLSEGKFDDVMPQLQKFFDTWRQVQQSAVVSAQALGADLDATRVNDLSLTGVLDLIKTQLTELKDAVEGRDTVVIADILRYEFDEPFAYWMAFLRQLLDATGR